MISLLVVLRRRLFQNISCMIQLTDGIMANTKKLEKEKLKKLYQAEKLSARLAGWGLIILIAVVIIIASLFYYGVYG